MIKNILRNLFSSLGKKTPGLVNIFLFIIYPFPRLFIAIAKWSGLSQAVMARTWSIRHGPLNGYRLFNLLPLEITPILTNSMEIRCSNLLLRLDIDNAIIFDVGASYGYYAFLLARLVKTGKVYAFEPDWRSYGRLVENLALNDISNVIPVPVCISNLRTSLLKWNSRKDDPWNSNLVEDRQADIQTMTVVPTMSLDVFSQMLDIQNQVRLIKIDVEGAELSVLEGAERLLLSAQPLLLCELHSAEIAEQVFDFLSARHYEWELIEYMNEARQHILAFPADQSVKCRAVISA